MNIGTGDDFKKGLTFLIEVYEYEDTIDYVMEISLPDTKQLSTLQFHALKNGLEEAVEKIQAVIEELDAQ